MERDCPVYRSHARNSTIVFLGDDTLVGTVGRAIRSHVHVADMRICMIKELIICLPAGRIESVMMSLRDAVSMSNGAARSSPVSKAYLRSPGSKNDICETATAPVRLNASIIDDNT